MTGPGAKRTPLKPSHLKIRRIPDRPHAASKKMAFRARWCELKNADWSAMRNQRPIGRPHVSESRKDL
ncbi:hypothetical protein GQ600_22808 [Phytophthora cactorum]|nr:hypothetical protein GQ600_22808 [Phytophthora cactorum]